MHTALHTMVTLGSCVCTCVLTGAVHLCESCPQQILAAVLVWVHL